MASYAATIAPVINAVHVNVHASARQERDDHAEACGLTPGFLGDLRYALPARPVTRDDLSVVYRYGSAADLDAEIGDHLRQGTLAEDGDGVLRLTAAGLSYVHGLYEVHAKAVARLWAAYDVPALAALLGEVLEGAVAEPGGAFAVMAPPYEPEGTPPGVLLFNRVAALRYHRADAHAAAWREAGLTADTVVELGCGPLRDRIEEDTNRRAAQPYATLTGGERETLFEGLLALI
ncbi:hypothetical protein [Nonomuraea rhodomycinica]|uniref:Uncharacterized protein n=1 Tax=Nonomuraea rhodomycinica TaxID=1712872 RepID=A0A7Y6ME33_9ACTN|nr:hypothetical protein [Nonomuraea rhodomycinica]NUW44492.1 hypothetical protein [Nonomuraea rhodomycinica]